MNKRKGISLIVLVITILVMLILSGVVIVSLSKNNPVNKAKEATFKEDIHSFNDELGMYIANKLSIQDNLNAVEINASGYDQVKKVINSFSKKYTNKIMIAGGKIIYIGNDKNEFKWAKECGLDVFRKVNAPDVSEGMIPIKYSNGNWVVCEETDSSWYNYENKEWANVMLSDGKYKAGVAPGTIVSDTDLGSMFVWIPRFAYSIVNYKTPVNSEGTTQNIFNISFVVGAGYTDEKGNRFLDTYAPSKVVEGETTPKVVHPGFGASTGMWVAKYEASMLEENTNTELNNNTLDKTVKILPGKNAWRYISIANILTNCSSIQEKENVYGKIKGTSGLIKSSQWGAVAYLTASKYGSIPVINNKLNKPQENVVIITTSGGDYKENKMQSTTGNVTGIYDMNGGSWEFVAAYFDNKNVNLGNYGGKYFKNNELNEEYKNMIEKYNVSDKESNPSKHSIIWSSRYDDSTYGNNYRREIARDRLNLSKEHIGDGIYEVTKEGENSYYGKNSTDNFLWMINNNATVNEYGKTVYNGDYSLIGNTYLPFLIRGGYGWNADGSGIFAILNDYGDPNSGIGFRPVII